MSCLGRGLAIANSSCGLATSKSHWAWCRTTASLQDAAKCSLETLWIPEEPGADCSRIHHPRRGPGLAGEVFWSQQRADLNVLCFKVVSHLLQSKSPPYTCAHPCGQDHGDGELTGKSWELFRWPQDETPKRTELLLDSSAEAVVCQHGMPPPMGAHSHLSPGWPLQDGVPCHPETNL